MKAYFPSRQPLSKDWFTKREAFSIVGAGRIACSHCGYDVFDALHLDHKNGDGWEHRKSQGQGGTGGGMRTYRWVNQHPEQAAEKLQILCANCHQLKTSLGYLPDQPPMTETQITFLASENWEPDYYED